RLRSFQSGGRANTMIRSGESAGLSSPRTLPLRGPRRLPKQWWVGYLFIAPAVALWMLVGAYTVYRSLRLAFSSWDGLSPTMSWVGLDNFKQFLGTNSVLTDEFDQAFLHNLFLCV